MDISPFALSATPYATAFLAGLLGGVHCAGMCGGVVGALVYGLPASGRPAWLGTAPYLLAYNTGRILTYVMGGAAVGHVGFMAGDALETYRGWFYLRILAAIFMIGLGLYIGRWWFGLLHMERIGGVVWERIRPLGQRLLPVRNPMQALALGLLWGWLPCGLVYSVLVWAFAAGGWAQGAGFMLSFGLGTLPTLLAMGVAAAALGNFLRRPGVRRAAGATVILFGVWTLAATLVHKVNVGLGCAVAN